MREKYVASVSKRDPEKLIKWTNVIYENLMTRGRDNLLHKSLERGGENNIKRLVMGNSIAHGSFNLLHGF